MQSQGFFFELRQQEPGETSCMNVPFTKFDQKIEQAVGKEGFDPVGIRGFCVSFFPVICFIKRTSFQIFTVFFF